MSEKDPLLEQKLVGYYLDRERSNPLPRAAEIASPSPRNDNVVV